MVTPHNPTTAVFLQHDSHHMLAFFFSDTCKHLVVSHPRSFGGTGDVCAKLSEGRERANVPHLLQKSVGLVFRQKAQTRCGLQDHRGSPPLLLRDRLLSNFQQLSDGVATLQERWQSELTFVGNQRTERKTGIS